MATWTCQYLLLRATFQKHTKTKLKSLIYTWQEMNEGFTSYGLPAHRKD